PARGLHGGEGVEGRCGRPRPPAPPPRATEPRLPADTRRLGSRSHGHRRAGRQLRGLEPADRAARDRPRAARLRDELPQGGLRLLVYAGAVLLERGDTLLQRRGAEEKRVEGTPCEE